MITRNPLIYLVDDEESFIIIIKKHLQNYGFTNILEFQSGEKCIESFDSRRKKPKYLFLDFSLDGLNGRDIMNYVKQKSRKTKVIIITSIDDDVLKEKCLANGADHFFTKSEVMEGLPETLLLSLRQKTNILDFFYKRFSKN